MWSLCPSHRRAVGILAIRFGVTFVAAAAMAVASHATAQEWLVEAGAAGRIEYTDNYFLTSTGTQSATTGSITPFVTAARRTETSDVTALVAVGANRVWGISPTVDYASGRFNLDGSVREASSALSGVASFVRSASLQYQSGQAGAPLALAFTNAASVTGAYTYALTERWLLGATAGAYSNRYDGVENGATFANNHGYYASGNVGYDYAEHTHFTFTAGYINYISDITHGDAATATFGVVHELSPRLTISASAGGFWSDTEPTQNGAGGTRVRDRGGLYGGEIRYTLSEGMQFGANFAENLGPSASGTLNKNEIAGAYLTQQFSERLTGRLGANYARTISPSTISSSSTSNYYAGEIGFSYLLAERWKLDAGYQTTRSQTAQISGEPRSNVVFVSIAYNWPGASFTDWVGRHPVTQGLPGAGPVSFPDRSSGSMLPPGAPPDARPPASLPFDPYTIP
jgi:hypothetical protein